MDKENIEVNNMVPESENEGECEQVEELSSDDEIAELKDKLLRFVAEFDNFRKRSSREK